MGALDENKREKRQIEEERGRMFISGRTGGISPKFPPKMKRLGLN